MGKKQNLCSVSRTAMYIDDVLSINNPEFGNYLVQIYPVEFELKDTTENTTSASYIYLLMSIWRDGQLHTSIHDNRDYNTSISTSESFRS